MPEMSGQARRLQTVNACRRLKSGNSH
ncbi:hypothetical protein EMIT0P218_10993 [Pseudomonas sp. IT-P218]